MKNKLSPQQALIYAMITVSAVDRDMSDAELRRIGSIVTDLPAFADYNEDWLIGEAQECGKALAKTGGLDTVLAMIKEALPPHLRETAYVLCAEVAATDLHVKAEEIRFLELLAEKLSIDKLNCAALERSARARHQTV